MKTSRFIALRSLSVHVARMACGMALLVAALGGVALANGGGGEGAPEIDAGSAMSALTLLTGGILLMTDRIRRGKSSS